MKKGSDTFARCIQFTNESWTELKEIMASLSSVSLSATVRYCIREVYKRRILGEGVE